MLPGLTVTRAAATALDAGKFVLSAMRMLPPLFSYTGFDCDMGFTVVVAVMTVAGSLLADIAYTVLDPRVQVRGISLSAYRSCSASGFGAGGCAARLAGQSWWWCRVC
jgi:hypothetical protein